MLNICPFSHIGSGFVYELSHSYYGVDTYVLYSLVGTQMTGNQ